VTDLKALHELVLANGDLDLRSVARLFTTAFDADGSIVFLVDESGQELRVGAAEPGSASAEARLSIPVGYGVSGLVALSGNGATLVDDEPRNPVHRELLGMTPGDRLVRMFLPARGLGSAILGVITVHRRRRDPFTEEDLRRGERFADLVGLRLYAQGLMGTAEEQQTIRDRLIAQAISAQEAERRRIAGDLHDGVTQALASLTFHLSAADTALSSADGVSVQVTEGLDQIRAARKLAALAYDETRAAISGLHSLLLDDLGLVAALESFGQTIPQLEVHFRGDSADEIGFVPDHCSAVLYRIAQEAVNNAVKHAVARRAVISLRRVGDSIVLGVTDDGVGFDVKSVRQRDPSTDPTEHFGLASIAERCALIGATLRVDSVEGRGTAVIVELPVQRIN